MRSEHILDEELAALESRSPLRREDVAEYVAQLPDETTLEFQLNVANLVGRVDGVVPLLGEIVAGDGLALDEDAELAVRYGAFAALCTYHRRNKNTRELQRLHDEYGHLFSNRAMYDALYSIFLRVRGEPEDVNRAIAIQQELLDEVTENPGLYQAHANTIAQAIEDGVITEEREGYLERAKRAITRAIRLWPEYGKYHVTRGRLLALEGEYDRAREEIEKGIDLEDPDKADYAIRIGQFQQHLLRTDFKEYEDRLRGRIGAAEEDIERLQNRSEEIIRNFRNTTLQFIGFFAAIIAAVITTIQIATNYPPESAARLIVTVFGGLTASFGSFSIIIPGDDSTKRDLAVVGFGLLLVVGVFAIPGL